MWNEIAMKSHLWWLRGADLRYLDGFDILRVILWFLFFYMASTPTFSSLQTDLFCSHKYHRVTMIQHCCSRQMVAAGWGGAWCLILQFSPYSQSPAFSLETTHRCRFRYNCSALFLCTSGFNCPFDFVEPHKFFSFRPILLAPIHCSHLGKPGSISALEFVSLWSHYGAVQSPASLLKHSSVNST